MNLQFGFIGTGMIDQTSNSNKIPVFRTLVSEDNTPQLMTNPAEVNPVKDRKTKPRIILDECRVRLPVVLFISVAEIGIGVSKGEFMMDMLELNSRFRVMELNGTNALGCATDIRRSDDGGVFIRCMNQQLVLRRQKLRLISNLLLNVSRFEENMIRTELSTSRQYKFPSVSRMISKIVSWGVGAIFGVGCVI